MRLKGKAALVTGAGQGFGFGIAEIFAARARGSPASTSSARSRRRRRRASGAAAIALTADVSKRAEVERGGAAAIEAFGRVDIVVNNAGTTHRNKPLMEVTDGRVRPHLRGQRQVDPADRAGLRAPYARKGRRRVHQCRLDRGASPPAGARPSTTPRKGAVHVMTKSMAVELAPDKIRVCALAPVAGETPLLAMFMGEDTPEKRAAFKATRAARPLLDAAGHRRPRRSYLGERRGGLPDRRGARGGRRALHLMHPAHGRIWISLTGRSFAAEKPLMGVGKAWISLDSLVRNEPFQWLTREFRRKYFRRPPPPARPARRGARRLAATRLILSSSRCRSSGP